MTTTVIGLGKIGLPLAVQFALKGEKVLGVDINQQTVDYVNAGIEPFPEEEHLAEYLKIAVESGNLQASTSARECVSKSEIVIVAVPLLVDKQDNPDFTSIDSVTSEIAEGLKKGTLVSYETTLPIGSTRNRFAADLELLTKMIVGVDFYVVFSPERVTTGRVFSDLRKYPKIVGGVTRECTKRGVSFYRKVLDFNLRSDLSQPNGVWALESSEAAEFVKLAETTYRDVNIALANQFAKYSDQIGLNIYEIIRAANSQPFSHIHQPGIAVGGHCIPIYPLFYLWNDPNANLVKNARELNSGMPDFVAQMVHEELKEYSSKKILILGAAYREKVKETAYSGVFPLYAKLRNLGYSVEVFDPLFSAEELTSFGLQTMKSPKSEFGVVIVQNASQEFINFFDDPSEWRNLISIYDGRNLFGGTPPIPGVSLTGIGLGRLR